MSESDKALSEAYHRFSASLRRYLNHRLRSSQDVDDIAQEVYVRVIQHLRPDVKPSWSFLRKIAANLLKDRIRRHRSHRIDAHISMDALELPSPSASPETMLLSKQGLELFEKVLEAVNPNSRRVFVLHRLKGFTYEEIAREMGISKSMVKKHITHVLLQFREKISEYI